MNVRKICISLLAFLLIFSFLPVNTNTSHAEEYSVELWNAIKPLETTVSFVNVGAHPDDERSDLLAYLSRGVGVDTVSLIANRGEGGQNQIGSELFTPLGIIRSMEMQEAAKVNGVAAFHLSETVDDDIYDFGFSKTKEETLGVWGEDVTYERLIRFIRTFRPDVIMPTFRDDPSQHGHHRTMSVLGIQAFDDAADPSIFPEHLSEGLKPWQARKAYLPAASPDSASFSVEIGDYDEIYGMSYPQLGEKSRYLHKSQGMGNDIPVEPRQTHFEIVDEKTLLEGNHDNPILNGIPVDFADWASLIPEENAELAKRFEQLDEQLKDTIAAYPDISAVYDSSALALETVRQLQAETESASLSEELTDDLLHKLSVKDNQLQVTNFTASKLSIDANIDSPILTQGQETTVTVDVENNGKETITNAAFTLITPDNWQVNGTEENVTINPGETAQVSYQVTVPNDAAYFDPYADPDIQVNVAYDAGNVQINQVAEVNDTVAVLPEISVQSTPEELVINTEDIQDEVTVTLRAKNYVNGNSEAKIILDTPEGWEVSPSEQVVQFSEKSEEQDVTFTVVPPSNIDKGSFHLDAKAIYNGKELTSTIQEIYYDHISKSFYQYPAQVKGIAFELNMVEDLTIGYVESGFDEVIDYLRNAGFNITSLTEEDLQSADLSVYDTIITGIRAYLAREDLVANNDRLLEYVENGGHLVVQHNLPAEMDAADPTPYPLKVGRPSIEWRVTDEHADVTLLNPDSPLFHFPNEISDSDWEHWIQERGLYFPMEWDDNYEALVSMADPNEDPMEGSLLFAEYGEGSYVYTSLGFYRQIQNQVAGGYRIFTNLISYGKYAEDTEVPEDIIVTSVETFEELDVPFGTELDKIELPETAEVTLSNNETVSIPVTWDQGNPRYDGNKADTYVFTGELQLDEAVINAHELVASFTVNVLEEDDTNDDDDKDDNGNGNTDNDDSDTKPTPGDTDNNKDKNKDNGDKQLPKTATATYTILLIGLIVLIISGITFFIRKRNAVE